MVPWRQQTQIHSHTHTHIHIFSLTHKHTNIHTLTYFLSLPPHTDTHTLLDYLSHCLFSIPAIYLHTYNSLGCSKISNLHTNCRGLNLMSKIFQPNKPFMKSPHLGFPLHWTSPLLLRYLGLGPLPLFSQQRDSRHVLMCHRAWES